MIELFGDATGNSTRAAMALEESGLTDEPRKVTLARGEHRAAEYLQLNPTGRVPTLVDSDGSGGERLVLTQSNAIMLSIAEKSETLFPSSSVESARALLHTRGIAGYTITTALEAQLRWDALPHVRRWLERVGARPAVQRGRRIF